MDLKQAEWGPGEIELMANSSVTLFWQPEILRQTSDQLEELGYEVRTLDASHGWHRFRLQISDLLNWELQFGYAAWTGVLPALNDGLGGYPFPPNGKAALVITDFQELVRTDERSSVGVLNLLEIHSRDFLLFGQRFIILVQTDDNRFACPKIGGCSPSWNTREQMNTSRGL